MNEEVVELVSSGRVHDQVAVSLKDVTKSFTKGKLPVLNNLNMRVKTGTLYGLLGASGCGKSSLFKVILGLLTMDRGEIRLFGHKPGERDLGVPGHNVGYMPQEVALYDELSIREMWLYFGLVSGMSMAEMKQRVKWMADFLDLKPLNRIISRLSGGQKRRVSFAAALLHQPPLLILDEPTVGLDPLLRNKIWNHLEYLSESLGTTIIISTHYMEESTRLHTIGMMGEGEILAEASPADLLISHQAKSLDEVFYSLCLDQSQGLKQLRPEVPLEPMEETLDENQKMFEKRKALRRKKVLATIWKNALRFYRHPGVLLFAFILPALQTAVAILAFGGSFSQLPLAIVNHDQKELGALFIDNIDSQVVRKDMFQSVEEGLRSVVSGSALGMMHIGENFTEGLMARFSHGVLAEEKEVWESTINLSLDLTNIQVALVLQRTLFLTFQDFTKTSLKSMGFNPLAFSLPINMTKAVYGEEDAPFSHFVVPAFMISMTYFLAVGLTALGFVMERVGGQADRNLAAGLSSLECVLGHVVTHSVILVVQVNLVFLVVFLIFPIVCHGSYVLAFLLLLLQGICGMMFGMLVGGVCEQENTAMMIVVGFFFPCIILNGSLWPVEALPIFVQYFSLAIPQSLSTQAFRAIVSKGWDLTHTTVHLGFSSTLLWISIHFIASVLVFRSKR